MKKIVIFIVSVLVLGVVAMYSCVANSKRIEQEKIKDTFVDVEQEEIQDNIMAENEIQNEVLEEIASSKENEENQEIVQEEQKEKIQTVTSNVSNKTTSVNTEQSSKTEIKEQEVKNTETQVKQEQPKTEENTKTTIQEEIDNVNTTKKEELIRNDQMIETIKNVIKNNETEDMRNFGYEIVVDSSIKEMTNQFTYSESRVKNYLRNKFGIIRIYAEDYYSNGQFIMTECYII